MSAIYIGAFDDDTHAQLLIFTIAHLSGLRQEHQHAHNWFAHPEDQIEEENEEKMRKNIGEWGKMKEMFLSYPPRVESLAMPLKQEVHFKGSQLDAFSP